MPAAVAAYDLRACHAERAVRVPCHRAWDRVIVGRPAAAGLELVCCFIERRSARGTCVDAVGGHVFIVDTSVRGFGAFLAEDAELLWREELGD